MDGTRQVADLVQHARAEDIERVRVHRLVQVDGPAAHHAARGLHRSPRGGLPGIVPEVESGRVRPLD
jgi:hypothetical protein